MGPPGASPWWLILKRPLLAQSNTTIYTGSESGWKVRSMGIGYEKLHAHRAAIEYVGWAYRYCKISRLGCDQRALPEKPAGPDADSDGVESAGEARPLTLLCKGLEGAAYFLRVSAVRAVLAVTPSNLPIANGTSLLE